MGAFDSFCFALMLIVGGSIAGTVNYRAWMHHNDWKEGLCTLETTEIGEDGVGECQCKECDDEGSCTPPKWIIECGMHVKISRIPEGGVASGSEKDLFERVPTPTVEDGFSMITFIRKDECLCEKSGLLGLGAQDKKDGESCAQLAAAKGKDQFTCTFRLEENPEYGNVIGVETPPGIYEGPPARVGGGGFAQFMRVVVMIASGLSIFFGICSFGVFCCAGGENTAPRGKRGVYRPGELSEELTSLADDDESIEEDDA